MKHSELFSSVKTVFDRQGWACSQIEGREILACGFEAHHARITLHLQAFPELKALSVVSESSLRTRDPLRRERLAELAMRVNHTLTVGAFEMNWDEGQLIFRLTNLFSSPAGDLAIISGMVHTAIREMDRVSPLEALIHQSSGPELAGIDILALLRREDLLPPA